MSQYTTRITLAVPEAMIPEANQLALVMGESAADVNTFSTASWQDAQSNKYAVCSAVSKPVILNALSTGLPDPVPSHAEEIVDIALAQQALDSLVIFSDAVVEYDENGEEISSTPATQVDPEKITLAIDGDPMTVLTAMGLSRIEEEI